MRRQRTHALAFLAGLLALAGCASVARVTNLDEPRCGAELQQSLSSIFVERGESEETATPLAGRTALSLATEDNGPRGFRVDSPSGATYIFFIAKKDNRCVLRLEVVSKGNWTYSNNLNYIAHRDLPSCTCAD